MAGRYFGVMNDEDIELFLKSGLLLDVDDKIYFIYCLILIILQVSLRYIQELFYLLQIEFLFVYHTVIFEFRAFFGVNMEEYLNGRSSSCISSSTFSPFRFAVVVIFYQP